MIKNYAIATIWATMDGASMIVCASKGPKLRKEQAEKKKKIRRCLTCSFGGKFTLQISGGGFEISEDLPMINCASQRCAPIYFLLSNFEHMFSRE